MSERLCWSFIFVRGALLALWFGVWYAVGWFACLVVKVVLYAAAAAAAGWRRAW